jgi:hypothetical protein
MLALANALNLVRSEQNADGGWGYRPGLSWTEPTAWAVLALAAGNDSGTAFERGCAWLRAAQLRDGGWPPSKAVEESTWVTALAVLALSHSGSVPQSGLEWLVERNGRETDWVQRVRDWMLNAKPADPSSGSGWFWYPGTAAWVIPTSFAILALAQAAPGVSTALAERIRERITEGRQFLLSRRCRDGGWNHGSAEALGYSSDSYPETTGLALLSLEQPPADALDAAERELKNCKSAQGTGWLQVGLFVHGRIHSEAVPAWRETLTDATLAVVTSAAVEGRNVLR